MAGSRAMTSQGTPRPFRILQSSRTCRGCVHSHTCVCKDSAPASLEAAKPESAGWARRASGADEVCGEFCLAWGDCFFVLFRLLTD